MTTPLPTGAPYFNAARAYYNRGWCFFEVRMASIVKDDWCLWDLSQHAEGDAISFDEAIQGSKKLGMSRSPPISPLQMARDLREGMASGHMSALIY